MPGVLVVIDWVVAPVLQILPNALDDVSVVLPPAVMVLVPEMVGVVGKGVTVTVIALLTAEVQPVTVFLILNE